MEKSVEQDRNRLVVDEEDEVVDYLQTIHAEEERAAERYGWDGVDTVGRVTDVSLVTNPGETLRMRAGIDNSVFTNIRSDADLLSSDIATAVTGDDSDWNAADPVVVVEVTLPSGTSFESVYEAPVCNANSPLHDLYETADVVPAAGDTLLDSSVPVDNDDDEWHIVTDPESTADADMEHATDSEPPISDTASRALIAAMILGNLLAVWSVFTPEGGVIGWGVGMLITWTALTIGMAQVNI